MVTSAADLGKKQKTGKTFLEAQFLSFQRRNLWFFLLCAMVRETIRKADAKWNLFFKFIVVA